MSSSDRVERFELGRDPGLLPGVPGLEPSEPGVPGLPGDGSSSGSESTSGGGPGFLIKNEIGEDSLENFYNTIEKINDIISSKKIFDF